MSHKINDTPLIPDYVYQNLPEPLLSSCRHFENPRERDVFLTSALGIMSGCFPNVSGKYGKDRVYAMLYIMVIAPAGSGKGVLKFARIYGEGLHLSIMKLSENERKAFFQKKKEEDEKSNKKSPSNEVAPKLKVLYIPGNTTSAKIYEHLKTNDGAGIICESETDTLGSSLKSQYGSFSDLLRKAYHHEAVSLTRKLDDQYYEIEQPKLAIVLSGTPGQTAGVVGSAEDGLMSRFIFYLFNDELKWRNQKPCADCPDLTQIITDKGKVIEAWASGCNAGKVEYILPDILYDTLDAFFSEKAELLNRLELQDVSGTLYRLGLSTFRIGMILTMLRNGDHLRKAEAIYCSETDFQISLRLADVYFHHALELHGILPKKNANNTGSGGVRLYTALPDIEFTNGEAVDIGLTIGIKARTVREHLKLLITRELIRRTAQGRYIKTEQEVHR